MRRAVATAIAVAALGGCTLDNPGPMWAQKRYADYRSSDFFLDGRAMQPPVSGTVPQEHARGTPEFLTGLKDGKPVERFPLSVDQSLMLRGRHDFEVFCSNCHGDLGDGQSQVAKAMSMRKPPPIADMEKIVPGHVFQVISNGYGFMPSFAPFIPVRARWGVVAYLMALHESQHAPLSAAPEPTRSMLAKERP